MLTNLISVVRDLIVFAGYTVVLVLVVGGLIILVKAFVHTVMKK